MKQKIAQFQILGQRWKIYKTDQLSSDIDGLCIYESKELLICSALPKEDFRITLLHEIGHAICYAFGLHLTRLPWQLEEILVESFAKAIATNFATLSKIMK